ncbi:AAA family ATPase [Candidatus Woesearchaeota archaeon]|nr:AAA family ATPase [Candidatus Woesearchaeota archaeon]
MASINDRIEQAKAHKKSGAALIYGHRGVGKTSLLKKIIDEAKGTDEKPANILYFYRRLGRTTSDEELYRLLNEELIAAIDSRKSLIEKLQSIGKRIENIGLKVVDLKLNPPELQQKSPYQLWKSCLNKLHDIDYFLIAIDDAEFLSVEAIGELKSIVEDIGPVPILLVVSAGVHFEGKLVDDYSPVARIFSGASFNIGKLDQNETKEVLEKPLVNERTNWDPVAVSEIHKLTGGYPYLIQCLAKASYTGNGVITKERVREHINDAIEIGKSWLNHEIPSASDHDILSFVKITSLEKNVFQSVAMTNVGIQSVYIGRLVKLGVIKKISRGRYELQKSPIIAEFEKLKRNLQT